MLSHFRRCSSLTFSALDPTARSRFCTVPSTFLHHYSSRVACDLTEDDLNTARKWLATFNKASLPENIGEISYSRSSGPGGQNVNKVNSKAQLRVPIERLLPHVPVILHAKLKSSRYYADKSSSLVIQSDDSRKQVDNRDSCFRKLHDIVVEVGKKAIPGETSETQKQKVKDLKRFENEARLKAKKHSSTKKASRSKSFGD